MFFMLWFAVLFGRSPYPGHYPACRDCGPPQGIPYHAPPPRPVMVRPPR